jgi:hypothetical protein
LNLVRATRRAGGTTGGCKGLISKTTKATKVNEALVRENEAHFFQAHANRDENEAHFFQAQTSSVGEAYYARQTNRVKEGGGDVHERVKGSNECAYATANYR